MPMFLSKSQDDDGTLMCLLKAHDGITMMCLLNSQDDAMSRRVVCRQHASIHDRHARSLKRLMRLTQSTSMTRHVIIILG